jgi:cell wall-associated NlpC family hydrolase
VIEDGAIEIPLRGYPDRPQPRVANAATGAPSTGGAARPATDAKSASGGRGGEMSQVVGRLGRTIAPSSDIYRQRDPRSPVLNRLPSGTYFAVKGQQEDYYAVLMIDGSIGWIPKTSVELLEYDVVADPQQPARPSFASGVSALAAGVLREAYRYLGVPYRWGGNGARGIDCSGLVRNVFAACGVPLPRTAHEQARVGAPVAFSELRAGDRLYFAVKRRSIDHTGIYLGNGYFIHASMSRGDVGVDRLTKPLYGTHLVDARRF